MSQTINPNRLDNRGGKRENSGRPKLKNVIYSRRINPVLIAMMDEYLEKLKAVIS